MKNELTDQDKKLLADHMRKEPLIINRVFNRTDKIGKMMDEYDIIPVVQNYESVKGDIIRKTCFACTMKGQCTTFVMSHPHICNRFNTPAVLQVTIPKKRCKGCIRKNKKRSKNPGDNEGIGGMDDAMTCTSCKMEGGIYRIHNSENFSFYAQEGAGFGGVHNDRDSFQNPQVCPTCGQLDLEKQRQWAFYNERARHEGM